MELLKKVSSQIAASALTAVVSSNVNQTCLFILHQPKLPEGLSKFKRI